MKRNLLTVISRSVAGLLLCLWCGACTPKSGLTTSEWFTHAQMNTMDITKGDILLKEGMRNRAIGDYDGAFDKWLQAAAFFRETGRNDKLITVLNHMAAGYLEINDYDLSLKYNKEALEIADEIKYASGVASSQIGLARAVFQLGDADEALNLFFKALSAVEKAGDRISHVNALLGIGAIYLRQQQYQLSLENYGQAFSIAQSSSYQKGVQTALLGMGTSRRRMEDYDGALGHFQRALMLARQTNDVGGIIDCLNHIGESYYAQRKLDKALSTLNEGLSISSVAGVDFPERKIFALYTKGAVYLQQGHKLKSAKTLKAAIEEIETVRQRIHQGEHRSGFLENKIVVYEDLIDLLLSEKAADQRLGSQNDPLIREFHQHGRNHEEIAFYFAESTKARSFLEQIASIRLEGVSDRIPPNLSEKEKKLLQYLFAVQSGAISFEGSEIEKARLREAEIKKVKGELSALIQQIKKNYPIYAAIKYPEPTQLQDIPLKANEIVLAFKVNRDAVYIWKIPHGKPPVLTRIGIGRTSLRNKITAFRLPLENIRKIDEFDPIEGEQLYRLLLQPALEDVNEEHHIIIIPDGPLNLLPFEALPMSTTEISIQKNQQAGFPGISRVKYLGEQFRISYYPSASVMTVIRHSHRTFPHVKSLFALGDPIYSETDQRYQKFLSSTNAASFSSQEEMDKRRLRDIVVRSGFSIPRLPETRSEVLKIGELFGLSPASEDIKLDENATEHQVKPAPFIDYRFIHFATHGIISGDIPYVMEPALVMSQVDKRGEDGFLKMSEVLNLKLNADMVVLSACKTALGREVVGEGVMGLGRAFMLAGSRSVVVSLWSVDSVATTALMNRFYEHIKSGKPRGEALWLARQDIKSSSFSVNIGRGVKIDGSTSEIHLQASHPCFPCHKLKILHLL